MMMSILNLPRNIRNLFENIVLLGIISGNRRLSPNPAAYLEIVNDEMLALSGSSMYSAYDNASFTVELKFLLYVLDHPVMSKLFNLHGANSITGCHYCEIRGEYNKNLSKVIYSDNRLYLPLSSLLRGDVKGFAAKNLCSASQPKSCTPESELQNQKRQSLATSKQQSLQIAKETGCKDSHPFVHLPGHRLE